MNFKEDVLIKDKNQSEFTLSLPIYLNKIITKERIKTGKENLKAWETQLAKIHKVWGVPPEVIIAIWGIETNFGEKLGTYRVVDTLATLAFGAEGEQRKALFKSELSALEEIKNKIYINNNSSVSYNIIIYTTGLQSDINYKKFTNKKLNAKIVPFRGEYYKLKEHAKGLVNHLVYPVGIQNFHSLVFTLQE